MAKYSNAFRQLSIKAPRKSIYVNSDTTVVMAKKKNIKQSPLKMKFLVGLIRGRWVPDALAQLKFSPKHRCVDVAKIVNVRRLICAKAMNLCNKYYFFVNRGLVRFQGFTMIAFQRNLPSKKS
jgi:ribosomal protein L22